MSNKLRNKIKEIVSNPHVQDEESLMELVVEPLLDLLTQEVERIIPKKIKTKGIRDWNPMVNGYNDAVDDMLNNLKKSK